MNATTLSKADRKRAGAPDEIRRLSAELDIARNIEHDFKRSRAIGAKLAPLLGDAYWNNPEVFALAQVRAARTFVAWLKRARYIEPARPAFYRGGSPGLGKR